MNVVRKILTIASVVAGLASAPLSAQTLARDIVLLLGNSQAMAQEAAGQILHKAIGGFLHRLSSADRVAILVYDDSTLAIAPFTEPTPQAIEDLVAQLDDIPYTSPYSNAASGIERALYELETHGRKEATKSIVLLGVMPLDTGEPHRDLAFSRWLREVLVDDARRGAIDIHTVALGDKPDKHSLQAIAAQTGGGFYVAEQGSDLILALAKVATGLGSQTPRQPSPSMQTQTHAPPSPIASVERPSTSKEDTPALRAAPPPIGAQQPLTGKPVDPSAETPSRAQPRQQAQGTRQVPRRDGFWRHPILYTSLASGVIAAVFGGLIMVLHRRAQVPATSALPKLILDGQAGTSRALLEDLNGATPQRYHRLGARLTWISRTPVEEAEGSSTVLIRSEQVDHKHAVIRRNSSEYRIGGAGDGHRTYVNDKPLEGERRLAHGDLLRFGDVVFRFVDERR